MGELSLHTSPKPFEFAGQLLAHALFQKGTGARLAIPGGSALLAARVAKSTLPAAFWDSLRITWVDERLVPFAHEDSNCGATYRQGLLLEHASAPKVLPLYLDGETGSQAVQRLTPAFRQLFGGEIDVALLGLGEDAHIASLFPGHTALQSADPFVAILDSPKPPSSRLSLGLSVLAHPNVRCILVAAGRTKRAALQRVLALEPGLPSTQLARLQVVTDESLTPPT